MPFATSGRGLLRSVVSFLAAVVLCGGTPGCERSSSNTETDAKINLTKILRLYQVYVEKNGKGPPDESALREFGKKLTPKELDEYLIGNDLETIFTSSRDKKPFVIQYNLILQPGGEMKTVAWEATAENGMRYVALSNGYVEEYDEETFQQYKKN